MTLSLKTAAASAILGVSALFSVAAPANADSLVLRFGTHGADAGIVINGHSRHRPHPMLVDDFGRHERPRHVRNRCTEDKALWKAENYGLRRVRVTFANHDVIGVKGRKHGENVRIVFARAPGCPVIRW